MAISPTDKNLRQAAPLNVSRDLLSLEGDVLFPLGGHESRVWKKKRAAYVKATRFISRFHDDVRYTNPVWTTPDHRHGLNTFMARILFSDDVGIFEKDVFETAERQSTRVDGAGEEIRGEPSRYFTSPSTIMKILEPILLDPLKAELDRAGTKRAKLRTFIARLGLIRVFDPACGSGNFLILAYKELRALETEAFRRLAEVCPSGIELEQFHGIEIDDFACKSARLGLWIANYQYDQQLELDLDQTAELFLTSSLIRKTPSL